MYERIKADKRYVYADFDWLKEIELIGELGYESLRGSDSYSFSFHDEWLKKHGNLLLSEDLNNYPGMQYTQPGKDIFGCFSDALPDRWGETPYAAIPAFRPYTGRAEDSLRLRNDPTGAFGWR